MMMVPTKLHDNYLSASLDKTPLRRIHLGFYRVTHKGWILNFFLILPLADPSPCRQLYTMAFNSLSNYYIYRQNALLKTELNYSHILRENSTNSNFIIPIFLEPDGGNFWYFKLGLFNLTLYYSLTYLRSTTLD